MQIVTKLKNGRRVVLYRGRYADCIAFVNKTFTRREVMKYTVTVANS